MEYKIMNKIVLNILLMIHYYCSTSLNPLHHEKNNQNILSIESYDTKSKPIHEFRAMLPKNLRAFSSPKTYTSTNGKYHFFKNIDSTGYIYTTEKIDYLFKKSSIKIIEVGILNNHQERLFTIQEINTVLEHIATQYPQAKKITWKIHDKKFKEKNLAQNLGFTITTIDSFKSFVRSDADMAIDDPLNEEYQKYTKFII